MDIWIYMEYVHMEYIWNKYIWGKLKVNDQLLLTFESLASSKMQEVFNICYIQQVFNNC